MAERSDVLRTPYWPAEIEVVAGTFLPGDTRESWLARAARRSKTTFRQIKALYYCETIDPKWSVGDRVLAAAARARLEAARRQASDLAGRFETIAGNLDAAPGADFHKPDIAVLLRAARALRGLDDA